VTLQIVAIRESDVMLRVLEWPRLNIKSWMMDVAVSPSKTRSNYNCIPIWA